MPHGTLSSTIDVRTIAPHERHRLILSTFKALRQGAALELVNDHDPRPLYYQLQAQMPGSLTWDYLEEGPQVWRVAITRITGEAASGNSCCGSCGGA